MPEQAHDAAWEAEEDRVAIEKIGKIYERLASGNLTPEDAASFDGMLNELCSSYFGGESGKQELWKTELGKAFVAMFSNPQSFAVINEYALRAYEAGALNYEIPVFDKLHMFANLAKQFAGDATLAGRFHYGVAPAIRGQRLATEADVNLFKLAGVEIDSGDMLEFLILKPVTRWYYQK